MENKIEGNAENKTEKPETQLTHIVVTLDRCFTYNGDHYGPGDEMVSVATAEALEAAQARVLLPPVKSKFEILATLRPDPEPDTIDL